MSLAMDVANAVVHELNDGEFAETFVAERRVLPQFELAALNDLRVTVVPRSLELGSSGRGLSSCDVQVDIGVQKKLSTDLESEVETLLDLCEELQTFLYRRTLTDLPQVAWVRTACEPLYVVEHLAEKRLFTGVLTVTYKGMR